MPLSSISGTRGSSAIRRFTLQLALVLGIFTSLAFVGIYLQTRHLVMDGVRSEADSAMDIVLTARRWNALHDGVWVRKTATAPSNPYLLRLGVEPDTSTVSGVSLTLRNPSAMTREISELTSGSLGISFRLTSLDPVNEHNVPSAWERLQLESFAQGDDRSERIQFVDGRRVYQRMRPLLTEDECLACHARQGYRAGDVRGGLSVTVPLARPDAELRNIALWLGALWAIVMGGLGAITYGLVFALAARIERGETKLRALAMTDALTGLPNRRATFDRIESEYSRMRRESTQLGLIVLDIDRFKAVNDRFQHEAGDAVLVVVSKRMHDALRDYDVVGRIGGEEFVVVAPDVDDRELIALAERVRGAVSSTPITLPQGETITVTLSAGCAVSDDRDEGPEPLLKRADAALYQAKEGGRDRTEVG